MKLQRACSIQIFTHTPDVGFISQLGQQNSNNNGRRESPLIRLSLAGWMDEMDKGMMQVSRPKTIHPSAHVHSGNMLQLLSI